MEPKHVRQLVTAKNAAAEPIAPDDHALGFKGWYGSGHLPHRDTAGTIQFVTYRLADSMPAERRSEWEALVHLEDRVDRSQRIKEYLDRGHGECILRNPRVAEAVQENLWHHDGLRYRLHAWVVMPNHVHVVVEIWSTPLPDVVHGWKSYTAKAINCVLGRSGRVWQPEYYDHYLRDSDELQRVVRYIENDPLRARLVAAPEDWSWSSARFRGAAGPVVPCLTHRTATRVPPPPTHVGEAQP